MIIVYYGVEFLWSKSGALIGYFGFGPEYEVVYTIHFHHTIIMPVDCQSEWNTIDSNLLIVPSVKQCKPYASVWTVEVSWWLFAYRRACQKKYGNPLGKIRYLWNCSKFFRQIYTVFRGGFRPHILQISLQYLVAFKNYNCLNLNVHFSKWTSN